MTSKALGAMWMRFWFLLSALWFAFCAYFAVDVPESNPDMWSTRITILGVGSLGFVLWIVGRFIRYGFNSKGH